ncbi:unnamed protein product [Camellia sinensis]
MKPHIYITSQDVIKEEPTKLFSPKNPTPLETIFLSNIDQAVIFPVETVFFFEAPPIKKSSSTLHISEQFNHVTSRLVLVCNNGGALFVSATSRLALKDLGNLSVPNSTFHHLIHSPGLYKSLDETALFIIQVTGFKCGGFALGFTTNHGILDGKSASEMFHSLASICRGETLKTQIIHNDRASIRARNPPQIKFTHKEYIKLPKNISSLPTSFISQINHGHLHLF